MQVRVLHDVPGGTCIASQWTKKQNSKQWCIIICNKVYRSYNNCLYCGVKHVTTGDFACHAQSGSGTGIPKISTFSGKLDHWVHSAISKDLQVTIHHLMLFYINKKRCIYQKQCAMPHIVVYVILIMQNWRNPPNVLNCTPGWKKILRETEKNFFKLSPELIFKSHTAIV